MSYRVLVVDDDRDVREVLRNLLTMKGYEVVAAEDGMTAVASMAKYHPDLMILDVSMPRMSGFQTCQAIRKMKGNDQIPVVFLSAKKSEQDKKYGERIGGDVYVTKPYNQNELLLIVERLLRQRAHPDEDREDLDQVRDDTSWVD